MIDYDSCVDFLSRKIADIPNTLMILGSGFSKYASTMKIEIEIPYSEIPGFLLTTNESHPGNLLVGEIKENRVVVMQGRFHFYEGYDVKNIIFPIRIFRLMGVKNVILTNASGGISPDCTPGTLVIVKDHISSLVPNCLRGQNDERLGVRFPDSSDIYSKEARNEILRRCSALGIELKEGVYIQTAGPSFETPAEIRAYGLLGADIVGMSTACEAIAASHAGMQVSCLSCVTNYASGISKTPLRVEEIEDTIHNIYPKLETVLTEMVDYFSLRSE